MPKGKLKLFRPTNLKRGNDEFLKKPIWES